MTKTWYDDVMIIMMMIDDNNDDTHAHKHIPVVIEL